MSCNSVGHDVVEEDGGIGVVVVQVSPHMFVHSAPEEEGDGTGAPDDSRLNDMSGLRRRRGSVKGTK